MNLLTKQKQTQTYGYQGGRMGWQGGQAQSLGLTHTHCYILETDNQKSLTLFYLPLTIKNL